MSRKWLTIVFVFLALATCVVSCRKEEFGRRPVYGDIYCRTPNPKAGDTIVLAARVIDAGNRIYRAEYSWHGKQKILGPVPIRVTAPNGSKTIEAEPTCTCIFSSPGRYEVKLYVTVEYSMPDERGAIKGRGVNSRGYNEIFNNIEIK